MDGASEIDVERIRQRIRDNLRRRREESSVPDAGLPPLNARVAADVAALHDTADDAPLTSHRRLLGPLVVLAKKLLRALLAPTLRRQAEYNRANARVVSALWQWTDWVAREQMALLRALHRPAPAGEAADARIAELERLVRELRTELAGRRPPSPASGDADVSAAAAPAAQAPGSQDAGRLDALYVALQDAFRGPRADVKARLAFYLPLVKEATSGGAAMPVLDLGSGRGEWLELLREHGVTARGVDRNRVLLDDCRRRGLDVEEGDVPACLHGLADGGLAAVTCFHVVEHLPFETLVELVDQIVRVLRPGGLAVFETPDPQNLLVASHAFHLDPTHRRPLPSAMLKLLVEVRGLRRVEVVRLNPSAEAVRVADEGSEVARRFNEYLYGPRDYAVIGWKP